MIQVTKKNEKALIGFFNFPVSIQKASDAKY